MEAEAEWLRNHRVGLGTHAGNFFEHFYGYFWEILETRDYMRARYAVVKTLGKIEPPTCASVQAMYDHAMAMLHLSYSDNMGVRDVVPGLMLRLGYDQECYDFVKWWVTTGAHGPSGYEDDAKRFLDIHGANVFESNDWLMTRGFLSASHLMAIILLKIRFALDMRRLRDTAETVKARLPVEIVDHIRAYVPLSPTVAQDRSFTQARPEHLKDRLRDVETDIQALCVVVTSANRYLWSEFLGPETSL